MSSGRNDTPFKAPRVLQPCDRWERSHSLIIHLFFFGGAAIAAKTIG